MLVLNRAFLAGAVLACVTAAWPPVNRIQQSKCQLTKLLFQTEAPWFVSEMGGRGDLDKCRNAKSFRFLKLYMAKLSPEWNRFHELCSKLQRPMPSCHMASLIGLRNNLQFTG